MLITVDDKFVDDRTIDLTISIGREPSNHLPHGAVTVIAAVGVPVCLPRYLSPTPQFFPTGFDVNVIREATVTAVIIGYC